MVTETETYQNEQDWRDATKRGGIRHLAGWRPISNSKDRLEITWNNDPPRAPPAKRQLTQRQLLQEIADERNVNIT